MHQIIGDPLRLANGQTLPLSKAIRAGDFVFLSGQLALDETGQLVGEEIAAQTEQCLENIRALLETADCTLQQVVKATVWLVEKSDFQGFNQVYAKYFPEQPPTRSAVCAELMLPGARVEIEVLAYAPGQA